MHSSSDVDGWQGGRTAVSQLGPPLTQPGGFCLAVSVSQAVKKGITIGWYIATVTIITAMPLLFEVRLSLLVC